MLAEKYGVEHVYSYNEFDKLLTAGVCDAIYLGTPNWRHAEFAIPALDAGIHVLCEKPLEISSEKAREIQDAERRSKAKLMTAYRLHFEPGTLDAIEKIRNGELGELVGFTSCFGQKLDPDNHRAKHGLEAGPLFDMAPTPSTPSVICSAPSRSRSKARLPRASLALAWATWTIPSPWCCACRVTSWPALRSAMP